MKNLFIIILFTAVLLKADSLYLGPSLFYTYGSYSNNTKSNAASFYNTLQLSRNSFLYKNFDLLKLSSNEWEYKQNQFIVGGSYIPFPFYFKAHIGYITGDYNSSLFDYSYTDFTNLYNFDLFLYNNLNYFGISYTGINKRGDLNYNINQLTFRFERILSDRFFISLKPNVSFSSDGSSFFSAALRFHYLPNPFIIIKTGGFFGERLFYFDSDLITFFNQPAIQNYQFFLQGEYFFNSNFGLILSYQHTKFDLYKINYLIAGAKFHLYF
jgi:hypothetical protein